MENLRNRVAVILRFFYKSFLVVESNWILFTWFLFGREQIAPTPSGSRS